MKFVCAWIERTSATNLKKP
nr:unnamed protein product [Callosobruchus analis]CAI5863053.1 unnamed protein product [Callosobruchus analis]